MVGFSAFVAVGAGEGSDGGASVDYEGLTLGNGFAYPDVDVVCAVALVEGSKLLMMGGEVAVTAGVVGSEVGFVWWRVGGLEFTAASVEYFTVWNDWE